MIGRMSVGLLLLAAAPVQAGEPAVKKLGERLVDSARELLGVPYDFGGRMRKSGDSTEGIDCLGVLFYAAERVGACGWKSYSVMPSRAVADLEFGKPVEGMAPVASDKLDVSLLMPGDILLLVSNYPNPAEGPVGTLGEWPVWVGHTGMYSGNGSWIVGDHFAGRVVETDLRRYLEKHPGYTGVFVTRMAKGPSPRHCRKNVPMKAPAPLSARVGPPSPPAPLPASASPERASGSGRAEGAVQGEGSRAGEPATPR